MFPRGCQESLRSVLVLVWLPEAHGKGKHGWVPPPGASLGSCGQEGALSFTARLKATLVSRCPAAHGYAQVQIVPWS